LVRGDPVVVLDGVTSSGGRFVAAIRRGGSRSHKSPRYFVIVEKDSRTSIHEANQIKIPSNPLTEKRGPLSKEWCESEARKHVTSTPAPAPSRTRAPAHSSTTITSHAPLSRGIRRKAPSAASASAAATVADYAAAEDEDDVEVEEVEDVEDEEEDSPKARKIAKLEAELKVLKDQSKQTEPAHLPAPLPAQPPAPQCVATGYGAPVLYALPPQMPAASYSLPPAAQSSSLPVVYSYFQMPPPMPHPMPQPVPQPAVQAHSHPVICIDPSCVAAPPVQLQQQYYAHPRSTYHY
jgi:hypothetical protein